MKKIYSIFLFACVLSGCYLEAPPTVGDYCPARDTEGRLSYIGNAETCHADDLTKCVINGGLYDFADNLKYHVCPSQFPHCLNKPDPTTGEKVYYCTDKITSCADGQILCDMPDGSKACLDPSSDKTCGASCSEGNYEGQNCKELKSTGFCSQINDKYVCVCSNESLLCDDYCIDPGNPKTCGANSCDAVNYGGANCAEDFEDYRVCEADASNFFTCQCPRGTVECNGRCIFPQNDPNFCGARGACNSDDPASDDYMGENCEAGEGFCRQGKCQCSGNIPWCKYEGSDKARCVFASDNETCNAKLEDGTETCTVTACNAYQTCTQRAQNDYYCKISACENTEERVCTINNEAQCVSYYDPEHCGVCDRNCSEHSFANVQVLGCLENEAAENAIQCTYQCIEGMTNCGTEFVPFCVDTKKNQLNCGTCGNACGTGQYCDNGTCKNTACDPHECTIEGTDANECVNTDEKCGPECAQCKNIHPNASCLNGVCVISACQAGQHPIYNDNGHIIRCEANTIYACAPVNSAIGDAVHNCDNEKGTGVNTVTCTSAGTCAVTECITGYHLSADGKSCIQNTATACGKKNSATTVSCTQQIGNSAKTTCEGDGVCKVTQCAANHHPNSAFTACVANTNTACGSTTSSSTTNCNGLSNVASASCVSGACQVSKCVTNYHINSNKTGCTVNSNTACAPVSSSSTKNCTSNAYEKVCNNSGVCACSKDGSTVLNYDKNACVIPACSGLPGVMAGTLREKNFYNGSLKDYACQATKCSPGYSIHVNGGGGDAQNCKPNKGTCSTGYKYTDTCQPCLNGKCGHSHCSTGYRYYIMACYPQNACCGTRDGNMDQASDYLCRNCAAKGQTCNITSGECQ